MQPTILIVDDNPQISKLMELMLKMEGYEVLLETEGTAAAQTAIAKLPTLIVMDVGLLNGPNGFEVAKILKANPSTAEIPIIFVTARNDMDDVVTGLELGVDYLTKPFAVPEFVARVRCALRQELRYRAAKGA